MKDEQTYSVLINGQVTMAAALHHLPVGQVTWYTITNKLMEKKANQLHSRANQTCFIANSCNFPILHKLHFKIFFLRK